MISKIIIVLIPSVLAGINVHIYDDEVQFFGDSIDIISNKERGTFHLYDDQIKDAVNNLIGGRPDDVFITSPTPWDDLYKRYGWPEVTRVLKVRSARVLGKRTEPKSLSRKRIHNDGTRNATYSGEVSQAEESTVTHQWSKGGSINFGQEINYELKLGVATGGGSVSFAFQSRFGQETVNTVTTTLGSKSAITIVIPPGQTIVVELKANKGTMEVEVEYEALLQGVVATNYGWTHKGHHFWAFDVNRVLDAGGLPRSVVWKEVMSIGFHTEDSITAYNATGRPFK